MEGKLLKQLSQSISAPRLEHSLGTRDLAVKLGNRYGLDKERVAMAALLHDCARELGNDRLTEFALQEGLVVGEAEKEMPVFLHGPVGAVIARKEYGVTDLKVLRAITLHTTGAQKMGLLDKVLFVADKVEPGRKYSGVEGLRELAFNNLDRCLLFCLDRSVRHSLEKGVILHPEICEARNGVLRDTIESRV